MDGVDVYSTAKSEYTEQFCIFLVPALQSYFLSVIEEAREKDKETRRLLWVFQNLLKDIPDWNQDKVLRETEKISSSTKCDYLEELLTAVFIAHTKVLSAIRLTNRDKKKIQITVPKLEHFLHRTLSESARILWSNAYLFSEQGTPIERQKNLRQVEMLLHQGVLQSIRSMLPVKNILREYLNPDVEEEEDEKDEKVEEEKPEVEKSEEEETSKLHESTVDISGAVQSSIAEPTPTPPPTPEPSSPPSLDTEREGGGATTESLVAPPPSSSSSTPQVLVFETEPSVKFSEHVTVFDETNPEGTQVQMREMSSGEEGNDEEMSLDILDTPPEAMDDFEDLEGGQANTDLNDQDFETLS